MEHAGFIDGLTHYFLFYNNEGKHQSLDYVTPDVVYKTEELGQRHSAVA